MSKMNNKTQVNVLLFFGEPLSYGGQESFIANMYSNFNNKNIKYTFATPFYANNDELLRQIEAKGDKVIALNMDFNRHRKRHILQAAEKIMTNGAFDVIHINSGSIFTLSRISKMAKKKKIKKIIVHSHATGYDTIRHKVIKTFFNIHLYNYADLFFACSKKAGEFKFSKRITESNKFKVIYNGINLNKFKFNPEKRAHIRRVYDIQDRHVLCNIGRFSEEKNQLFLLKVFRKYLEMDDKGFLLLLGGSGPLEKNINAHIRKHALQNNVLLLKERKDVFDFLSAADLFIFPSKFEGLGISVVEAQASGLPIVCSDNIPEEAKITKEYYTLSLRATLDEWAHCVKKHILNNRSRKSISGEVEKFDAKRCANELEKEYLID